MEALSTRKFTLLLPYLPKLPVSKMLALPVDDPAALAIAYQDLLQDMATAADGNVVARMAAIASASELEVKQAAKDETAMADLIARAEERPFAEVLTEAVQVFTAAGLLLGLPPRYFGIKVTEPEKPAEKPKKARTSKP